MLIEDSDCSLQIELNPMQQYIFILNQIISLKKMQIIMIKLNLSVRQKYSIKK